jgi:hypothetical protein
MWLCDCVTVCYCLLLYVTVFLCVTVCDCVTVCYCLLLYMTVFLCVTVCDCVTVCYCLLLYVTVFLCVTVFDCVSVLLLITLCDCFYVLLCVTVYSSMWLCYCVLLFITIRDCVTVCYCVTACYYVSLCVTVSVCLRSHSQTSQQVLTKLATLLRHCRTEQYNSIFRSPWRNCEARATLAALAQGTVWVPSCVLLWTLQNCAALVTYGSNLV